jgi:hypothetical protein
MYGITPPPYYGIWTVWKELALFPKLIFLSVFILSIYSLWTAIATVVRLRGLADTSQEEDGLGKNALVALRKRCVKIHQINGILFYLFGFVLFLSLQLAYINTPESNRPLDELITHNFIRVFVFGANVFFLFAVIHLALWFASSRIDGYASKLNAPKPELPFP